MKIPLSFLAPIKTLFTSISETSHINSYPFPRNAGILLLSSILSLTTVTSQSSRAQVWTNKTKYHPNEAIVVHFNGMSGANSDWIAVTQSHKGDNTYDIYKYIQGEREGSLSFSNLKSGSYEARAYFKNTYVVQARYAFTISTNDSPTSGNDNAAYKPIGNDVKPTDLGLNSQSRIGSVECFTCGATSNYHNLRGSDTYTPDSYICSAAIHAGKIGPAGGNVCIRITAPPTTWGKGKRNGVTSFGTGAKHSTGFVFTNGDARDQSDILPPDNPFIQLPPPTTIDNSNNNSNSNRDYRTIGNDVKPSDFGLNDKSRIGSVECFTCGATSNYHNLRGSDTYTPDSYICSAAIHAGKIGPAGGNVCIQITAPPATWGKGKRNGVTSFGTGAKHPTGFIFTGNAHHGSANLIPHSDPFVQLPPPSSTNNASTAWRVDYGPYEVDGLTVSATPSGDGKTSYYIAPRNYHGNWSGYTGISFEKKSWGGSYYGPTSHGAYGDVVLKSGKMTATLTISKDHTGNFRYYTIPFNSRVWRLEGGAIRIGDVLRNVTDFRIRAEYGEGTDYSSIRNVGLLK